MAELSRFFGIVIYLVFKDVGKHHTPHLHVYYGEYEAVVAIDGELLEGTLPTKKMRAVRVWLDLHREEAYKAWNLAVQRKSFEKIPPLK